MSHYKLIYFNGQGKAEIIRLIFSAAGIPFEDVRLSLSPEKWTEMKPIIASPMGQLPVLETDGERLFQSLAISRYLAKKFGLAGKSDLDQAKVDIIVDCIEDAIEPIPYFYRIETDETKKTQLKKTYIEETLPKFLDNLEKLLKTNKNGDGYFVGDSLTWADLQLLTFLCRLQLLVGLADPFGNHPKLKALDQRVNSLPNIAKYVAERPQTPF